MKEAVFQYKCRMCGAVFDGGILPDCIYARLHLMAVAVDQDLLADMAVVNKQLNHACDETRVGLADLIGYRIEG